MNISTKIGVRASKPMRRTRQGGATSRGAVLGQIFAIKAIRAMNTAVNRKPGMNPAKYSRPIDSSTNTP